MATAARNNKNRGIETVALDEAVGRTLAKAPKAETEHPSTNVSAMDGYAVISDDDSTVFSKIGVAAAGGGELPRLQKGQTVAIYTGATLPKRADAVIPQEFAEEKDGRVRFAKKAQRGEFVRPKGADFRYGDKPLEVGKRLTPYSLALAAAMNIGRLSVYRRPKVAIMASGDELLPLGKKPPPGMLIASSVHGIKPLLEAAGARVEYLGAVRDDEKRLLAKALSVRVDLLVSTGGVSVGARDAVANLIKSGKITKVFNKVAMRPGKPTTLAYLKRGKRITPWLGLPGNPVSAMLGALLLAAPMVERMQGLEVASDFDRLLQNAVLAAPLSKNSERTSFIRAKTKGNGEVSALALQDSAYLSPLAAADCLIVRRPYGVALGAGDKVMTLPICRTF